MQRGGTWTASTPTKVMEFRYYRGSENNMLRTYDVSLDGRRFLMVKDLPAPNEGSATPRIVVVQHWFEELERLVPTK